MFTRRTMPALLPVTCCLLLIDAGEASLTSTRASSRLQAQQQTLRNKRSMLQTYADVREQQLQALEASAKAKEAAGDEASASGPCGFDDATLILMRRFGLPDDHTCGK